MGGTVRRHMGLAVLVAGAIVLLFLYLLHEQIKTKSVRVSARIESIRKQEEEHREQRREVHNETIKELKKRVQPVQEDYVPDALRGLYERQQRRSVDPES